MEMKNIYKMTAQMMLDELEKTKPDKKNIKRTKQRRTIKNY